MRLVYAFDCVDDRCGIIPSMLAMEIIDMGHMDERLVDSHLSIMVAAIMTFDGYSRDKIQRT
jgi:hypothetical protein